MDVIIENLGVGVVSAILCFLAAGTICYFYLAQMKLKRRCSYEVNALCVNVREGRRTYNKNTKSYRLSYIYSYSYYFNGKEYMIEDGFISGKKLENGHRRRFFINPEKTGAENEFWDGGEKSLSESFLRLLLFGTVLFAAVGIIALLTN
ncbi:MAG: hypothetical protein K6F39_05945 [Lachnospiraceae bacterium]|nr:hypothetical protein [Lachnospiraceae bacterium]